jgi:hypothetical protein
MAHRGLLPFIRSSMFDVRCSAFIFSPMNSILIIKPYWWEGTWVFDDPAVGLTREPFVAGIPDMIDLLVRDIPSARDGFRLLFSATPFPGYQAQFLKTRPETGGTWYRTAPPWPNMEGWLCPALFKYFDEAPEVIYVKAEPLMK